MELRPLLGCLDPMIGPSPGLLHGRSFCMVQETPGQYKVILATNVAETAVTIDGVVCVINSGRAKEKRFDPFSGVSTLQTTWISKASEKQRRGRAGRTRTGVAFHIYSHQRAASFLVRPCPFQLFVRAFIVPVPFCHTICGQAHCPALEHMCLQQAPTCALTDSCCSGVQPRYTPH